MRRFLNGINSYMTFFTIAIGLKFIFLRYFLFEDFNILNTIWYELSGLLMLVALIEVIFRRGKLFPYLVLNLVVSILLFSIVVYEKYFGTLPTYYDLSQLNQLESVSESIAILISPTDFLFFIDFVLLAIILLVKIKVPTLLRAQFSNRTLTQLFVAALFIFSINFAMNKDEQILDQASFSKDHGVLNAQVIKLYSDKWKATSAAFKNVSTEDLIQLKGNEPVPFEEHQFYNLASNKNLLLIQVESLQDFVIDLEIDGQEITPNINKWIDESIYFSNMFQQIGAGNTSDAEFIVNTSIYPLGETPTSNHIKDKEIPSLPKLLSKHGYTTSTFHADTLTYWNRTELYPVLGFDEAYGLENYFEEKDVVGFGPSDEYFFDRTMDKLLEYQQEEKPFYAHLLTLTSHTPFEMPEDKEMLNLPEKYEGTFVGNYLQSVHYTDYALGLFFDELKETGLWDESIIALYGDHSGVHGRLLEDTDVELMHELLGHPYSVVDRFNIPFIIGIPGVTEANPMELSRTAGQLDIMPTILNLMGIEPEGLTFGHNVLQYEHNLLGMRYYLATGAFFNDNILFRPETAKNDARIYQLDRENTETIESDPQLYEEDYLKMLEIYEYSDAYFDSLSVGE